MSTSQVSQPLQQATPHEILDLQADIKRVLEHVVASHEEQKKTSKGVDELAAKVKVLERVLCGDVGCPKKNMDPVIVQKGGLVQRLADMDAAIGNLLGLVTRLKTDRCVFLNNLYFLHFPELVQIAPPVYHDASISACVPSPSVQDGMTFHTCSSAFMTADAPPTRICVRFGRSAGNVASIIDASITTSISFSAVLF